MKYLFAIILLLACTSLAVSQDYNTKKTTSKKALKFYLEGEQLNKRRSHEAAVIRFSKAIKKDKKFINAYLLRADSYYAMNKLALAEQDFEKVLALDPVFEKRVWYVLGVIEYKASKFEEAKQHLAQFLSYEQKSDRLKKQAEQYLAYSTFGAEAVKNPLPFKPVNLGMNINSKYPEYLPALTVDGEILIFTVRLGNQEDFFVSKKENGAWTLRQNLGEPINTHENEGAQTVSANGKIMVYTTCNRPNDYGSCDLYYTEFINGRWTRPYNIEKPINTGSWESQPSLSPDGKSLYFTSNRGGSKGGKDIWVSHRKEDGSWSEPENLNINTTADDESPFIHPDNETLYFMSNGYPGLGGSDLYFSKKQADGSWGEPKNLGYPINTQANEGALIVSTDGTTAYFASDKKGGFGAVDIYSFELHESIRPKTVTYAKIVVIDADTKQPLQAKLEIMDLGSSQLHATLDSDSEGEALACLPLGKDYALSIDKKGYIFHSENFALREVNTVLEPFVLEIELQKIPPQPTEPIASTEKPKPKSNPVILKNIFFETGSAELLYTSRGELARLKKLMVENKNIKVQINGHTDNVGSEEDNLRLSEARAKSVVNYLIDKGIDGSRLSWKGFGESQPIDTNDTERGRKNNRRTEFMIVE